MSTRENSLAELVARCDGYLAGVHFAQGELFYFDPTTLRICDHCGEKFWPFFEMPTKLQDKWRADPPVRYRRCGGITMWYKDRELCSCHTCYVKMGEADDERRKRKDFER